MGSLITIPKDESSLTIVIKGTVVNKRKQSSRIQKKVPALIFRTNSV